MFLSVTPFLNLLSMFSFPIIKQETNEELVEVLFNKTPVPSPECPDTVFIILHYSLPHTEPLNGCS